MVTAKLKEIFDRSFQSFLTNERRNILNGVNERNLCARLAICIEGIKTEFGFAQYYADTEYNRKQRGEVKTILDDALQVVVINCDLIFHSRGEIVERDNLIVVEMKKAGRPNAEKERDRSRLRAMTKASYDGVWSSDGKTQPEHVCGYELGVYIELDLSGKIYRIEEFRAGNIVSVVEARF